MKPGRELDALVAEKVMGVEVARGVQCSYECGFKNDDMGIAASRLEALGWVTHYPIPYYSTDIAAAWEVVEHIGVGWSLTLARYSSISSAGHGWLACFAKSIHPADSTKSYYPDVVAHGLADTAPHALCLAALRVVGVEVE